MIGYCSAEPLSEWYSTGDRGFLLDGQVNILGRIDSVETMSDGKKINKNEIMEEICTILHIDKCLINRKGDSFIIEIPGIDNISDLERNMIQKFFHPYRTVIVCR